MEIRDRILKLMENERLTAAQFADKIGIQRSTISHILSGRNNPGYDVLVKILQRFTKVHAEWLILGTGNMYKSIIQSTLNFNTENDDLSTNSSENISTDENKLSNDFKNDNIIGLSIPSNNLSPDKKLEKIILLYSDKTFSIYNHESN